METTLLELRMFGSTYRSKPCAHRARIEFQQEPSQPEKLIKIAEKKRESSLLPPRILSMGPLAFPLAIPHASMTSQMHV